MGNVASGRSGVSGVSKVRTQDWTRGNVAFSFKRRCVNTSSHFLLVRISTPHGFSDGREMCSIMRVSTLGDLLHPTFLQAPLQWLERQHQLSGFHYGTCTQKTI